MLFNIVLRQCDIQIGIVVNKLYIYCKETYKKLIFPGIAEIKAIDTKYSKHRPYTVAHIEWYVC